MMGTVEAISEANYVVFVLRRALLGNDGPLSILGCAGPDFVEAFLRSVKARVLERLLPLHGCCRRVLKESGCDVHLGSLEVNNPVYLAALHGHDDCIRTLRRAGCATDLEASHNGWIPAYAAAAFGHEGCLRALLEAGCDLDQGWNRQTPAYIAAVHGHVGCLRVLQEAGCDLQKTDLYGRTPACLALMNGNLDCWRLLTKGEWQGWV